MAAALATGNWANTAIRPDFAQRINLAQAVGDSVGTTSQSQARASALDLRVAITQPGSSRVGDLWSMNSAFNGIDVRDPTADARVIDYSYSVPDEVFHAQGGLDRMLIRTAMAGLLPDEVRLNPDRGRQSADLVARLRASAPEVDAALAEVAGGPAEEYVSMAKMRGAWSAAQQSDDPMATHRAGSILLRGIMAALWITRTYG
jgi:asparagine synthase (glutamine-hydrolysing)